VTIGDREIHVVEEDVVGEARVEVDVGLFVVVVVEVKGSDPGVLMAIELTTKPARVITLMFITLPILPINLNKTKKNTLLACL
jgi:hypothetical protein